MDKELFNLQPNQLKWKLTFFLCNQVGDYNGDILILKNYVAEKYLLFGFIFLK